MSVLGESNILDLSFKAFSSQEDSSSKKFSYDDYENITNQFSNVLIQQVNYEPQENSYSSNDYVYEEESFSESKAQENTNKTDSEQNKYTDKSEISSKEYNSSHSQQTKDSLTSVSEHINFREQVEKLAYSSKDISQILNTKQLSNSDISQQKSTIKKILEQNDIQTNNLQKKGIDKSQLQNDLSNKLSELHGKTKKTDSINSLKEKLENLIKNTSDKNQKQIEISAQKNNQSIKEVTLRKNELLKTPTDELTETLVDLNVENIKTSKYSSSKTLKGQLSELAAKASLKEVDLANNGENSFMNQHQESHDGMNSYLNSSNSILSSNNSVSKLEGVNNTDFNKLLNSMEQQHNVDMDVLNQVVNKMKHNMTSINGKNSISMILNPQNLGKLNIDLVSHNGILSAEIKAENEQTKELLTRNIDSLKQSLQEQGVTVGNVIVKSQESSLSNNNFTKDFSQGNMKDFDSNNKTGSQKQNFEQNSQTNYEHDLQQEEHQNKKSIKTINSLHNGLVDYTI